VFPVERVVLVSCLAALMISSPAAAQSDLTGNWTGTYTSSIQLSTCQNQTFTSNGNVSATLLQTGTSLSGRMDLTNVLVFSGNCTPANQEVTRVVVGTVSAPAVVDWRFPNDPNGTVFSGAIDGNAITAQISDANGVSGSLTMTRRSGDTPAFNLTGSWSGNYSFIDTCSNGATQTYTGASTLGLTQSGGRAGGVITMDNVPLYDQNCQKITSLNMSLSAAGVISGSTFLGAVFDPAGSFEFPISATITNAAMSGTVAGANQTATKGTFMLSQVSSQPPGSGLSGSYAGTYSETDNETLFCLNIGTLTYGGPASVAIVQAGNAVSGSLILEQAQDVSPDGFGGCVVVNVAEEVLPLYGNISGNTLTLLLPLGGNAADQFTVNFSGDAMMGTITDSFGDLASFSATKSAPPVINTFASSPSSITSGQSTTLSWSTTNATAVSIDNGVGSQPPSGSVTLSPSQTTVYTLTATGPAGSVTAQTTVTVSAPGPRRRTVRP
jgi:hypothetical protein